MAAICAARPCHARRMPRESHHACCSTKSCAATGAVGIRGCVSGRPAFMHGDRYRLRYATGQRLDHRDHRWPGGGLVGWFAIASQRPGSRIGGVGIRVSATAWHGHARAYPVAGGVPAVGGRAFASGLLVPCDRPGGGVRDAGRDRGTDRPFTSPCDVRRRA